MILDIRKIKNPVLRKKCLEVKEITPEIRKLVQDMKETMEKNKGVGLAANQVGALKRVITIDLRFANQGFLALINPKVIKKSREKEIEEEGCLSFPDIFLKIKRAKEVIVRTKNVEGKEMDLKAEGLLARVLQHEIDHLDGILFFDRLPLWQRIKFKFKNKLY